MLNVEKNLKLSLPKVRKKRRANILLNQYFSSKFLVGFLEIVVHWSLKMLPIALCSYIGGLLGRVIGPRHRKATQRLRDNITQLRPDLKTAEAIDKMVRQTWENYGRLMTEYSVLQRIGNSDRTEVCGVEHLIKAQGCGRPIIFTFLHLSNWEIIGPKLHHLCGGSVIHIYETLKDPVKLYIAMRVRRSYAAFFMTNGPFIGKKIYNKLRNGYYLNMAVDDEKNKNIYIPSFGRCLPSTGNLNFAVRFAKLTNAVICPLYVTRTKGARFQLHIMPPLIFDFSEFDKKKIIEIAKQLDELFDPIVRKYIDQWYYASLLNLAKN